MKKNFVMIHDERRCIGCQACSVACRSENGVPESVTRLQVRIQGPGGEAPNLYFQYPRVSCQQCKTSPCVTVCPTGASYVTEDGIVSVKPSLCVGCLYCLAACPYKVRFINPENKSADKCNFCTDSRLKRDAPPACVDICPTGALTFGDLNEAGSKVRQLLNTEVTYQSKMHLGTQPRMYRIPTRRGGIENG